MDKDFKDLRHVQDNNGSLSVVETSTKLTTKNKHTIIMMITIVVLAMMVGSLVTFILMQNELTNQHNLSSRNITEVKFEEWENWGYEFSTEWQDWGYEVVEFYYNFRDTPINRRTPRFWLFPSLR